MYSLVLMAALTTGGSTPAFHGLCGCHGGYHGCYGCYGCTGCYGCSGCYGGCWGGYGCYGCYGCHGCYGCYGGCWGCYSCSGCCGGYAVTTEIPQAAIPRAEEGAPRKEEKKKKEETAAPARARVVVQLPADARLYIDDHLMKTASAKREFNTPQLQQGQMYYYILRTEVVRSGKTFSETRRVLVKAGEEIHASFGEPKKEYVATRQDR